MIRAAFLTLVVLATTACEQTKPAGTKASDTPTSITKHDSTPGRATVTSSTGAKTPSAASPGPAATKVPSSGATPTRTANSTPEKTTLSGVYTLEEAAAGQELYSALCGTCHLATNPHNGPEFRKNWAGKTLSQLFVYMRTSMPKNDPGSLADEDYESILAYMLQMNKMPPGKAYLSTDTLELRKIKFDTIRSVRKP